MEEGGLLARDEGSTKTRESIQQAESAEETGEKQRNEERRGRRKRRNENPPSTKGKTPSQLVRKTNNHVIGGLLSEPRFLQQ